MQAVQALQSGLKQDNTDAAAWEALGCAYQSLGRLTAAIKVVSLGSLQLDLLSKCLAYKTPKQYFACRKGLKMLLTLSNAKSLMLS